MTNSQMFKLAHAGAKQDRAFDSSYSYAYYFQLHLLGYQKAKREANATLVIGFQIKEPGRVWA